MIWCFSVLAVFRAFGASKSVFLEEGVVINLDWHQNTVFFSNKSGNGNNLDTFYM